MTLTPTNSHGGASGGGAVTVADGADVTEGAVADAAIVTNTTGTVSGKLRVIVAHLAGTLRVGGTVASDAAVTDNPLLDGGRASTATPTPVSADGDAVAAWLTRSGAVVVDGGIASDSPVTQNPVVIGGRASTALPTAVSTAGDVVAQWLTLNGTTMIGVRTSGGSDGAGAANMIGDASDTGRPLQVASWISNGSTFDRERGNEQATLLASAARTVATSSADQTNYNGRGVAVVVNVTVEGAATLTLTVQGKDSISGNYYELITGIVVYTAATDTPPTTRAVVLYPGILTADAIGIAGATGQTGKSVNVPRIWRVTVTPADATTTTYSVAGVTLL